MRKEMKKVLSLVLVGTILTGCAGSAGSKTAGGTDGDKAPAAVEKTEANEEETEKFVCPECGNESIIPTGGCGICLQCGYSKCN